MKEKLANKYNYRLADITIEQDFSPTAELVVSDPESILILLHKQKWAILEVLISEEYTIRDLSQLLDLNPGSVKRHLTDLLKHRLIVRHKTIRNEFGITLKYYRAVAQKYKILRILPKEEENND